MLVTIAPFDDVEVRDGRTLEQLRPHLASATARPELRTATLTVDGHTLAPDQVCGHEPLVAGAIIHVGPSPDDAARTAVRAPWHLAVVEGPDSGHLTAPGPDGRILVRGSAPRTGNPARRRPGHPCGGILALGDPQVTQIEVRVRVSRRRARVRWCSEGRRSRVWRPGRSLTIGSSLLELRWRPDREPAAWRRRRTRPAARAGQSSAATASAVVPLVSSVAMGIALHNAALLIVGVVGATAVALTRRFDGRRAAVREQQARDRLRRDHPGRVQPDDDHGDDVHGSALVAACTRSTEPAALARWIAGPGREPVWDGPPTLLDHLPERCLRIEGEPDLRRAVVRAMVLDAVARAAPGRIEVAVVGAGASSCAWDWARWLPVPVHRSAGPIPRVRPGDKNDRALLVVCDGRLTRTAAVDLSRWWHGATPRSALLVLADHPEECPPWCRAVLDLVTSTIIAADGTNTAIGTPGVSTAWAEAAARRLAGRRPQGHHLGVGSRVVALTGLPGLPGPDPGSIGATWAAAGTVGAPVLSAPIGTALQDARPVTVELSRDGPHLLIAGTTGAGKSELLQTLVLSLAAQHSPAHLVLALVDFKGGASLGPCTRLPHVNGRADDLDPLLARRALAGLQAELRRREALLARHGVTDIDQLWDRVTGAPGASAPQLAEQSESDRGVPLPRLVIVVDELRALVDDVPEAVATLARIAALGRAMGMHLVLATQRPAGALSADARANIGIRMALRVSDPSDSVDVLGIPDAAEIPHDQPGRAVLRVATSEPVPFQTARASAHRDDQEPARLAGARPGRGPSSESPSPADAWVDAICAAWAQVGEPSAGPLWQPPLPAQIALENVATPARTNGQPADGLAWGVTDLVDEQRRGLAHWRPEAGGFLVVGRAGSGRTTTTHTLATTALAHGHHVHVVSSTPERFASLVDHPGFGTLASTLDGRIVQRLLEHVTSASRGAASLEPQPAAPETLLVLDDLPELVATLEGRSRSAPASLAAALRPGGSSGPAVVATSSPGRLGRELSAGLPQRLLLGTPEATDLAEGIPSTLARHAARPGLGIFPASRDGVLVQVALARHPPEIEERSRRRTPEAVAPLQLRALPADAGRAPRGCASLGAVPLGLGGDDGRQVAVDLVDGCFLCVGPARSGRSTVLAVLAGALTDLGLQALVVADDGPLLDLAARGARAGVVVTERPSAEQLESAELIVIDGLDQLDWLHPGWSDAVAARRASGRRRGPVVLASVSTDRAALGFRGLLGDLRRAGCGIVLRADAPGSREVFATPIEAMIDDSSALPGRGVLVDRHGPVPVQVFGGP